MVSGFPSSQKISRTDYCLVSAALVRPLRWAWTRASFPAG